MEEQDVFIAYHGTYDKDGSIEKAKEIFYFLESRGVRCYFFPNENNEFFAETPVEVKKSGKFLLVCNSNIERGKDGSVIANGVLQEITTFWNCIYEGKRKRGDARVYVYDGLTSADANDLHIAFQGVAHFDEAMYDDNDRCFEDIYNWIVDNSEVSPSPSMELQHNMSVKSPGASSPDISKELKTVYIQRATMNKNWNLSKMVSVANRIECLGISNNEMTLKMDPAVLLEALNKGTEIELVFLDPNGKFTRFREREENQEHNTIKNNTKTTLNFALRLKKNSEQGKVFDNLKIYTYDKVPRMNMIFIDGKHLLLQYYANSVPGAENPCFYIKKVADGQIFDFYYSQYKKIRDEGKEHV